MKITIAGAHDSKDYEVEKTPEAMKEFFLDHLVFLEQEKKDHLIRSLLKPENTFAIISPEAFRETPGTRQRINWRPIDQELEQSLFLLKLKCHEILMEGFRGKKCMRCKKRHLTKWEKLKCRITNLFKKS